MPVRLHHVVIDSHDLTALADFWAEALHWPVLSTREREVIVGPSLDAPIGRRVDVGQTGQESWDVLADPEGNEFCVVRPKTTLVS